jgi:hypothetical protein
METPAQDLNVLEKKIFQQYNSDGAFETILGIGLLCSSLILFHVVQSTFGGILPILLILVIRAWKKRITYPRLGYVELSAFRQKNRRLQKLLIFTVLAVILVYAAILLFHQGDNDPWLKYVWVVSMSIIGIVVVGITLFRARQAPILYAFAALVVVFLLLVFTKIMNPATMLLISGGAFLIYGLIKLVRFLRNNPPLVGDAAHDPLR